MQVVAKCCVMTLNEDSSVFLFQLLLLLLLLGRDVVNVEGVVGNVWNIRDSKAATSGISSSSCNNNNSSTSEDAGDLALFTDDGPLAKESQKVFSLSMYSFRGDSSQRRENSAEVMLYFYGIWAEKCAFFSPGDLLTISGPASMVSTGNSK